jgi:hypothetical protein
MLQNVWQKQKQNKTKQNKKRSEYFRLKLPEYYISSNGDQIAFGQVGIVLGPIRTQNQVPLM